MSGGLSKEKTDGTCPFWTPMGINSELTNLRSKQAVEASLRSDYDEVIFDHCDTFRIISRTLTEAKIAIRP